MKKAEAIEVGFKVVGMYAFMQGITALGLPISLHESAIAMRAALQGRAAAMPEIFSPLELVPALLRFFWGRSYCWKPEKHVLIRRSKNG